MWISYNLYLLLYLIPIGVNQENRDIVIVRRLNILLISYSEYISSLHSFIRLLLRIYIYSVDKIDFKHTHKHTHTHIYTHNCIASYIKRGIKKEKTRLLSLTHWKIWKICATHICILIILNNFLHNLYPANLVGLVLSVLFFSH